MIPSEERSSANGDASARPPAVADPPDAPGLQAVLADAPAIAPVLEENVLVLVAVVAIIRRAGRILAMRRSRHKDAGAGLWETLSGRVRQGEDPFDAVQREIAEECGLDVEVDPRPVDCYQALRRDVPMVLVVYGARWLAGEVRLSEEHDEYRWATSEEFAALSTLGRLVESVRRFESLCSSDT